MIVGPKLSDADITYFSTMASIAATLLGLSFLALTFFLTSIFSRYDRLALPVFLQEYRSKDKHRGGRAPASNGYGTLMRFNPPERKADGVDFQRTPSDI